MIFADQPFKIGERVNVGGYDGPVEEVGLRSTKIRTLDGHLVSIPNSVIANEKIENIGRRPSIKKMFKIGVTYDTGFAKLRRAIEIIKEILDATDGLDDLKVVRFFEFADFSLNILVIYWVKNPDYLGKFLPINESVNLEILKRFDAEGIQFAFPTRTIHLVRANPDEPGVTS
jgi:MscS family membrane protein